MRGRRVAGTAVITPKEALLWTDGRYFLQAAKQLDPNHWKLMKSGLVETPSIERYLADVRSSPIHSSLSDRRLIERWVRRLAVVAAEFRHWHRLGALLQRYCAIGATTAAAAAAAAAAAVEQQQQKQQLAQYGRLMRTVSVRAVSAARLETVLKTKGHVLRPLEKNLVDEVWGDQRPAPPLGSVFVHPLKYAGEVRGGGCSRDLRRNGDIDCGVVVGCVARTARGCAASSGQTRCRA
jgi:hypothetical protein